MNAAAVLDAVSHDWQACSMPQPAAHRGMHQLLMLPTQRGWPVGLLLHELQLASGVAAKASRALFTLPQP